jgi:outer membrane protein assembly factor BamA
MKLPAPQNLLMLLWLCGPILAQTQNSPKIIDAIEIRGARNIPPETLKAIIGTKPGDVFSEAALARDFAALWKTGSFSGIELKTELGAHGGLMVRFVLTDGKDQRLETVIDAIEIRGARNIPPETLKAIIGTKPGDAYNEEAIGRDAAALWKIGSFSDIQLTNQTGPGGGAIVRFTLMQKQ